MAETNVEPVYLAVGKRIAELRRQKDFTQNRLAEAAGVTVNYLARVETGVHRATLPKLEAIAAALGVGLGSVFTARAPEPASPLLPELAEACAALSREDQRLLLRVAAKFPSITHRRPGRKSSRPRKRR